MSEIRSTGSRDQVLGWDPYRYGPIERDLDQLFEWLRDEEEHDWWCAVEPPAEDLIGVLERAS